jgi:putative DNA primase/helicase
MCEGLRTDPETADWYLEKGLTGGMRELKCIWEKAGGRDEAEIARLRRLPRLEYERERRAAAKRLGDIRVTELDKLIMGKPDLAEPPALYGRGLVFAKLEPWHERVDCAALLDEISAAIRHHVVMTQTAADAVALWTAAVHVFDAWVIFPRLFITAPEKQCGKTTLLDAVSRLVPKPLLASNVTASSIFRVIEIARPSLLLDEADAYARDDEALRSIINAGHRRDGTVIRTTGDNYEPRLFSVWAPMALAAIGRLPGTIVDRSITIELQRRRPDEQITSLRLDRAGPLDDLARKAARWAKDTPLGVLAEADPKMPQGLENRAADNWQPLLVVASVAGGQWPDKAHQAAAELGMPRNDDSTKTMLLADLRDLFDAESTGVVFTSEILAKLADRLDRPWPEWGKSGKPITARQLAAQLKPLRIATNNTVWRGELHGKGYKRKSFDDAFARYLPPTERCNGADGQIV